MTTVNLPTSSLVSSRWLFNIPKIEGRSTLPNIEGRSTLPNIEGRSTLPNIEGRSTRHRKSPTPTLIDIARKVINL